MEARRKGADVQQQIDHAAEQYSRPQRWGLSGLHEPHQFLQQATRHRGSEPSSTSGVHTQQRQETRHHPEGRRCAGERHAQRDADQGRCQE